MPTNISTSWLFVLKGIFQRRFEDALRKLQADLDTKLAQRDEMKEKRRLEKEGGAGGAAESEGGDGDVDSDNSEVDENVDMVR